MHVTSKIDSANELTIFTVEGKVNLEELMVHYIAYYEAPHPTMNVVWDFRLSDGAGTITKENIEEFASVPVRYVDKRSTGKTAHVVRSVLGFGLARMLSSYVEMEGLEIMTEAFKEMDEALEWIDSSK
jgi:hypothetical protein